MPSLKPRILIFSTAYFPHIGGAEVAIKEIAERLSGWDCDLITARLAVGLSSEEQIGAIRVYRVGFGYPIDKALLPIFGTVKALQLLSRKRYEVFWAMMVTFASGIPYIVNILRRLFLKQPIPVVLTLQEGDSEEHIKAKQFGGIGLLWRMVMTPFIFGLPKHLRSLGLIGVSWSLALKRTSIVTAISHYLAEQVKDYGYAGPLVLIPNGVDGPLFSAKVDKTEAVKLRQKLGFSPEDKILVTTSRLVHKNGVDVVISALPLLPSAVKFVIVGSGPLEEDLRRLAITSGVADRVCFVGSVDHHTTPLYLAMADIFVRLSRSEGMGISFIEAMAARLPVIATPVGGIPDFLRPGETGWLCPVDDARTLAEIVTQILDPQNTLTVARIVGQAGALVEKYDWRLIAEKMNDVFVQFVDPKHETKY